MHALILAAGAGNRLNPEGAPKPLTRLENGETPLKRTLEALDGMISPEKIVLVVGYKHELFAPYANHHRLVMAPDFASTNTAKSLLLGLEQLDDDVIWINGDVVFHPEVMSKLAATRGNAMVVAPSQDLDEEEVKYLTDNRGNLVAVSKEVSRGEGEAVGINRFCRKDLQTLKRALSLCSDADYFEKAIESCIINGVVVKALAIAQNQATEIDFPEDLIRANKLIATWK